MFSGKVVHLPLKEFSDCNAVQNAENRTVAKTLPLFLQYYAKATNIQIVEINQSLFKINSWNLVYQNGTFEFAFSVHHLDDTGIVQS